MQSMRTPLGRIDTRLAMTDSAEVDFHSPSFASVVPFDGPHYGGDGEMEEMDLGVHGRLLEVRSTLDDSETFPFRESAKQYPPLELDVEMDKYHSLDDFTEPLNPQNTPVSRSAPASRNGCESLQDACRHKNRDNLRTSSAPQIQTMYLDWRPPGSSLHLLDGDDALVTRPQTSISPIPRPKKMDEASTSHPRKEIDTVILSARCVRFTPPPDSPPRHPPRPKHLPVPSVERKQDYIASFRQKKQFEKWRSATHVKAQRTSPYRSPKKATQIPYNPMNLQPEIRFSSLSQSPFHRHDEAGSSNTPRPKSLAESHTREAGILTVDPGLTPSVAPRHQLFDLVAVSLSLHRVHNSIQFSGAGLRAMNLQLTYTIRPMSTWLQEENPRSAVCNTAVNDLILHTFFVVPSFLLRVPLSMLHAINQFAHTRPGLALLFILHLFWSLAVELIIPLLSKLGMEIILFSDHRTHH
ncbi:hypothetical protein N7532_010878 [Penicillium argentinense]|uniref:Uncharacterized protein n=1 Tax=Penicillium argentinense TaxID=1131581 RepID=A0A9W9EQE9_9EURO|nr:uncharacterized protein N7532_010878 [Penicillium argentinense]KAJ5086107.1 hypothetical protein N7532_010878 [Penicillium argentinense]